MVYASVLWDIIDKASQFGHDANFVISRIKYYKEELAANNRVWATYEDWKQYGAEKRVWTEILHRTEESFPRSDPRSNLRLAAQRRQTPRPQQTPGPRQTLAPQQSPRIAPRPQRVAEGGLAQRLSLLRPQTIGSTTTLERLAGMEAKIGRIEAENGRLKRMLEGHNKTIERLSEKLEGQNEKVEALEDRIRDSG